MSTVSRSINTRFPSRRPQRARFAAFCMALTAAALFTAIPSHATQYASPAAGGTILYPGDTITNGSVVLKFEGNQNLVLYNGSTAVWSSGTSSTPCSNCFAHFQNQGNLVLYNPNSNPQAYWASSWHVSGNSGALLVVDSALPFPRIYQAGSLKWGGMSTLKGVGFPGSTPLCNAMAWSQVPDHPNFLIGRNLEPCNSSGRWYLSIGEMNWATQQLEEVRRLFEGPQTIRGNYRLIDAYDPHVYKRSDGSTWLAFECQYDLPTTGVGSCMGRLLTPSGDPNTWSIDPNSLSLVVQHGAGGGYRYSASVPKVVQFGGEDYLYYSAVRIDSNNVWRPPFHTYGIKLHQVDGAFFEYSSNSPIQSVVGGGTTTQVWAANPQDPYLGNEVADGFAVWTEGPYLYMTGGQGGSGCIVQSASGGFNGSTNIGCYRLAIARTTTPLEPQAFNYSLVSDLELPTNVAQYAAPVKDPLTNRNYLLVGLLSPPTGAPAWNRYPTPSYGELVLMPRDGIMDAAFLPTWLGIYASGHFNMSAGETLYMASGFLTYQMYGNLVLYNNYWNPLWASNFWAPDYCQGHACWLRFQSDGNLVAYRDTWSNPYFATNTAYISPPGSSLAWLLFANKPNNCHVQIWQDGTNWFCQ